MNVELNICSMEQNEKILQHNSYELFSCKAKLNPSATKFLIMTPFYIGILQTKLSLDSLRRAIG